MKTLYTLILCAVTVSALGQAPELTLSSEEITISPEAFNEIQATLGGDPHTIRLYASFPDNYELQVIYGNTFTPWTLSSESGFYQHAQGGPTTIDINGGLYPTFPALEFDSWFTIGYLDNTGNSLFVLPMDGSAFDEWEAGGNLLIDDFIGGSLGESALPTSFPPNTPDENGRVLIGQFTSASDITGCFNLQLRRLNEDGSVYLPTETWIISECFTHTFGGVNNCVADFDQNGVVATSDLLLFMPEFGCTSGCSKDLSDDGSVTTTDMLLFLGYFGTECPGQ